jgi:hypothetical protein
MPSTERLFAEAVQWANNQGLAHPILPQCRTVDQVHADTPPPHHSTAIAAVHNATFAGETDAQRCNTR